MSVSREPRARVALIDLQLADCDRLQANLGKKLQVSLVIAPSEHSPLARWAELGGYPWATDLEALTAVVADTVAVAAESPRRADALALAGALGARPAIFGTLPGSEEEGRPAPEEALAASLEVALASLFEPEGETDSPADSWAPARNAGFRAGVVFAAGESHSAADVIHRFGEPDALELLGAIASEARRAPRGWATLALAEQGFWKAWCALAPEGVEGPAIALGGRLLPAHGYGPPGDDSAEQRADRRIAERLVRDEWLTVAKGRR
jgi:hypothetical protein